MSTSSQPKVVVFDCDGVLVDAVSSWRTLHDSFGTDNAVKGKKSYDKSSIRINEKINI